MSEKKDTGFLAQISSPVGEAQPESTLTDDAVFGVISENGPNYRNVRTVLIAVQLGSN